MSSRSRHGGGRSGRSRSRDRGRDHGRDAGSDGPAASQDSKPLTQRASASIQALLGDDPAASHVPNEPIITGAGQPASSNPSGSVAVQRGSADVWAQRPDVFAASLHTQQAPPATDPPRKRRASGWDSSAPSVSASEARPGLEHYGGALPKPPPPPPTPDIPQGKDGKGKGKKGDFPVRIVQLTASNASAICAQYKMGRCYYGASCRRLHDIGGGNYMTSRPPGKDETPNHAITMTKKAAGFVLGAAGEEVNKIRVATNTVIDRDVETPPEGFITLKVFGSEQNAKTAADMIQRRFATCDVSAAVPPGLCREAVQVDQRHIRFVLGKQGNLLKEIQKETEVTACVDNTTETQGYIVVRLVGLAEQIESAKSKIDAICQKEPPKRKNPNDGRPEQQHQQFPPQQQPPEQEQYVPPPPQYCDGLQVEQVFVEHIIGPGGVILQDIKEQSGAKILIDQETKELGYSIVRIGDAVGSTQNRLARQLVLMKVQECRSTGIGAPPLQLGLVAEGSSAKRPPPPPPPPMAIADVMTGLVVPPPPMVVPPPPMSNGAPFQAPAIPQYM